MAWGIVKEEEALCKSPCEALKDVDCMVHLGKQVISCKPAITLLSWLENDPGFTLRK
jgi:hypothetical protein